MRNYFAPAAAILAFALCGIAQADGAEPRVAPSDTEVWSFDMWCVEMQMYPEARCSEKRPQDLNDYDDYRKDFEAYMREKSQENRKNAELQQMIHRDQTPGGRNTP